MKDYIEFTSSQVKAYQDGASMFIVPLNKQNISLMDIYGIGGVMLPLQTGDKDVYIKEEFLYTHAAIGDK